MLVCGTQTSGNLDLSGGVTGSSSSILSVTCWYLPHVYFLSLEDKSGFKVIEVFVW